MLLKCVASLPAGVMFGEKGLDENVLRTATVICGQDCIFGIMRKEDYIRILKEPSL